MFTRISIALVVLSAAMRAQPTITTVYNAFSFQPAFSPGALVAITGKNLYAGATATNGPGNPASVVMVSGKAAAILFSSATQLNVQLPVDVPVGATTLTVSAGGQSSAAYNLSLNAYAPAINIGSGAAVFLDGTSFKQITAATPGENIVTYATGLGATNPAVATGATPTAAAPTVAKVTATLGAEAAVVLFAGLVPSAATGIYQVNLTVPKDATGCATRLVLTIGGISSPSVALPITTAQPVICAAENAASGLVRDAVHGAAATSFLAIYAASPAVTNSAGNIFPATNYQGIEVDFNGAPLPLYNVTNLPPSQVLINTALPANAGSSGSGTITVKNSSGNSQSYTVALAPADLGVFRLPDPNNAARVQGVVLVANTFWFAMPASLAPSYNLTACTGLPAASPCGQPAKPGDAIVIYLTGGGLATPNGDPNGKPLATGVVAPLDGSVIYQMAARPSITIGGLPATAAFSGIAPGTASEYQINTTIPASVQSGDDVPIVITVGNSTDTVTIAVKAQ
jgi:uncharacterized protein (TIGR03437 family)